MEIPAPLRHVADDGVARHGLAALGVAHHQTAQALNLDAGSEADPVYHPPDDAGLHFLKVLRRGVGMQCAERLHNGDVATADRDLQPSPIGEAERLGRLPQLLGFRRREPTALQLARDLFAAQHHALFLFLVAYPGFDLVPRSRGADMGEPVAARLGIGAGQDLDGVPVTQLPVQGRDATVDLGALAVDTDFGVHHEGEIDRGRTLGELLHVALRREDEDFVLVQVDLEELEELLRRVGILLQLDKLSEPVELLVQLVATPVGFVQPVGRDTELRRAVHLLGPDLNLE